jgi:hypothetical protein
MSEQGPEDTPVDRFFDIYADYVLGRISYQEMCDAFNQLTEDEQFEVRERFQRETGVPFQLQQGI